MSDINTPGSSDRPLRVAIVGSGPAGFYAADALLGQRAVSVHVDMFERLPTPYGLVRAGVAPDHQKMKRVAGQYERSAGRTGFRFLGNVTLGRDVEASELREHYDQIIYAVGSQSERRLGIPGEGLMACTPAAVFVGWYNGHPDYRPAPVDLGGRRAVVIGHGNAAIDVTRILAKTSEELARTDIAGYALTALSESQIREIVVIGRGGPERATFTPKELAELGKLADAEVVVDPADLEDLPLAEADRRVTRNLEVLRELASRPRGERSRTIRFVFLRSPVSILGDRHGHVRTVRLETNERSANGTAAPVRGIGVIEELDADLIIPAIGFETVPLPGVPFDTESKVIANDEGRIVDPSEGRRVQPNEYVVGWARSGARGLIGAHKKASGEVVGLVLEDAAGGTVPARALPPLGALSETLRRRGVELVSFDDWRRLDEVERARGERRGAPRDKLTAVDEMLEVIR